MKQLNLIRNLFSVAVMMTLACNVSAQVSIRDRIQIMDRDIFNYPESNRKHLSKQRKARQTELSIRTGLEIKVMKTRISSVSGLHTGLVHPIT